MADEKIEAAIMAGHCRPQQYKSWCGHAFEMLSWNHAGNIAHALGVARSDYSVTCATVDNSEGSAQIDLLFDVRGGAMYLFELKFNDHPYVMVAAEAKQLLRRRQVLEREYSGSRSINVCLFTPCGAKRNPQLDSVVDLVLDEAAVFRDAALTPDAVYPVDQHQHRNQRREDDSDDHR